MLVFPGLLMPGSVDDTCSSDVSCSCCPRLLADLTSHINSTGERCTCGSDNHEDLVCIYPMRRPTELASKGEVYRRDKV